MDATETELLPTLYHCPGEEHPISRSVHLSRLAAFYPKCRDCQHRSDTGQLPQQTVERIQSTEKRVERPSLLTDEGVRGVYLNEFTRQRAAQLAGAFASLLWEAAPLKGQLDSKSVAVKQRRHGPSIVIGQDQRSSSPDIVLGVSEMLRRMGCQLIDVGLVTRPCFSFNVAHLDATAGILVTGSGCDQAWSGLDFVTKQAKPVSRFDASRVANDSSLISLEDIETLAAEGFDRPTRNAGQQRRFQASTPYESGLWKHFHALRPLKIACGCPVWILSKTLSRLFERLPCDLQLIELPTRRRDLDNDEDVDIENISDYVVENECHLGLVINDDGARCRFLDESGVPISDAAVACLIAAIIQSDSEKIGISVQDEVRESVEQGVEEFRSNVFSTPPFQRGLFESMLANDSTIGLGSATGVWFQETIPTCDAILTLARMLQSLSQSDKPLSKLIATYQAQTMDGDAAAS